ncbi:MAG: hypothetical protein F4Z17_07670 [Acidimicrobiia bacterium]|nr:hypothetical protein [Acidimicrobiia bacterium]
MLVLRLGQHQQSLFAEIMLVHPHVELAANSDLIVSPEHSTLPYRIVAQASSVGVVWTHQLGALIGQVDDVALEALGDVAVGEPFEREGLTTGPPLRGRFDPRWDFKAQEGEIIRTLAADCTSTVLYEGPPLQLDPGCLALEYLDTCDDPETVLYRLLDLVSQYDITFDKKDVAVLEEVGALDVSNWIDTFGTLGDDLYKGFWPLMERALSTIHLTDDTTVTQPTDEWTRDRKKNCGTFQRRSGHGVLSASYVCDRDRELSIELATEYEVTLIDV